MNDTDYDLKVMRVLKKMHQPSGRHATRWLEVDGVLYGWEPTLLVADDDRSIEQEKAPLAYKRAQAATFAGDPVWGPRLAREVAIFGEWVEKQPSSRPARELTWGNCVAETGLLRPIHPE